VAGVNANGTVRVERVLPDGTVVGRRQFIVRAGDLRRADDGPTPEVRPSRSADTQRRTAAAKFAGAVSGPMSEQELRLLAEDLSVSVDELRREVAARQIEVR
jgi:hypothetical protein